MSWLSTALFGKKPTLPEAPQLETTNDLIGMVTGGMKDAYSTGSFGGDLGAGTRDALDNLLDSVTGRISRGFDERGQNITDELSKRGFGLAGSNLTGELTKLGREEGYNIAETTANLEYNYLLEKERREQEVRQNALSNLYNIGINELGIRNQQLTLGYERSLKEYESAVNARSSRIGLAGSLLTLTGMAGGFGGDIQGALSGRSAFNLNSKKTGTPSNNSTNLLNTWVNWLGGGR